MYIIKIIKNYIYLVKKIWNMW